MLLRAGPCLLTAFTRGAGYLTAAVVTRKLWLRDGARIPAEADDSRRARQQSPLPGEGS
jgi:hypothetical protein